LVTSTCLGFGFRVWIMMRMGMIPKVSSMYGFRKCIIPTRTSGNLILKIED